MSAWMTACSKDETKEPDEEIPVLTLAEEYLKLDFDLNETTVTIPVETNMPVEKWSVSSDQKWCTVTNELSAITVEIDASTEPSVRAAEISVKSPAQDYTIKIRQLGTEPAVLVEPEIRISPDGETIKVSVTANVEYGMSITPRSDWLKAAPKGRSLTPTVSTYVAEPNYTGKTRRANFTYSNLQYTENYAACVLTQESKKVGVSDVEMEGEIKVVPTGGKDSEHEEGYGIANTYDGKFGGSPYRTAPGQAANFPVELEYFFDAQDIDYLIYHTCGGEGNFGQVDLYTATESAPDYKLYDSYDFKMQHTASRIDFAERLAKVTKIKFSVKTGLQERVSCDEMEFFRKNSDNQLETKLLEVFTDILCTELRADATDEKIMSLPGYFINLAQQLKNGTYDKYEKDFRIQEYEPYSYPEEWADQLMMKKYTNLDNPTGIYVEPGDSLFVLVGDLHGQTISLQCIGDEEVDGKLQPAASGETHFIREGINKLGFSQGGMLFVMYNTDLTSEQAQPVKIHIPLGSGQIGGFYDVKRHVTNGKYQELIFRSNYKYFCVRGEHVMFYFHINTMRPLLPYKVLPSIKFWDNIVGWQQSLLGIDDVRPSKFNNHIMMISHEGDTMWADDYRIGIPLSKLSYILTENKWSTAVESIWEPSCIIGHLHKEAIDWPGVSQSSNTLFANYALWKSEKFCSRGYGLSLLADARLLRNQAWWELGFGTPQAEDVEMHTRMFWQLWNYFHHCKYQSDFCQSLFKLLRTNPLPKNDPGKAQLDFVKKVCRVSNLNLTDFFEMWGFFEPVDVTIEQNGTHDYQVTESMIADTKAYIAQFPAPQHVFYYIEDRKNGEPGIDGYAVGDVGHFIQFKDNMRFFETPTYSRDGQNITISEDGERGVAFEIRKGDELLYFSNFLQFTVPAIVNLDDSGIEYFGMQADGRRKLLSQQ